MSEFAFIGTYEAREVPKGWQHPRGINGKHIPLLPYGYAGDENDGPPATPDTTMPPSPWQGEAEVIAYEAVSEGTPISPAFPATAEGRLALCAWCADNVLVLNTRKVGVEAWAALLFHDALITADGIVVAEG
jgi:hypothetical protein